MDRRKYNYNPQWTAGFNTSLTLHLDAAIPIPLPDRDYDKPQAARDNDMVFGMILAAHANETVID